MASHARSTGDSTIWKNSILKNGLKIITLYNFFSKYSMLECQLTCFTVISSVECCTHTFVSCYQINACSIISAWIVLTVICIHFTIPPFKSIWTHTAENRSVISLTPCLNYVFKIITFMPFAKAKEFYLWNNGTLATGFTFYHLKCSKET